MKKEKTKKLGRNKNIKIIQNILLLFIVGIIIGVVNTVQQAINDINTNNPYHSNTQIILDAKQFYTENEFTTVTPDELIAIKGEPQNKEDWIYEINENTSYPITTYNYPDGEEYHFYNGHLSWIMITRNIEYTSKNSILSMFNLEINSNTQKMADTNYALKYRNCGVYEIWITGIENNTFQNVKIKLLESPF